MKWLSWGWKKWNARDKIPTRTPNDSRNLFLVGILGTEWFAMGLQPSLSRGSLLLFTSGWDGALGAKLRVVLNDRDSRIQKATSQS
jgi:hypothetical protein